ncbi:hypothetical protein ALC53_07463 [Atta colombica]|uniref:Uncharacterized protein n=1 Tax=Atta colombica TaxID=520822 RepID=A0A195BBW3_9HYME|nr:hypothetical protein ALC53_07463 [Atta colombica]
MIMNPNGDVQFNEEQCADAYNEDSSQPADTLATSLKFTAMHHAHRAAFHSRPRMVCIVDLAGVIPVNILQRTIHYRVRGQCWHVIANQRATGLYHFDGCGYKNITRLSLGENDAQRRFHRHLRDLAEKGHTTRKKTSESGFGPDLELKCIPNECPPTSLAGAGAGASMLGGGRPGKILKTPNVQLEASGSWKRMRLCRMVEQLKTR